MKDIDEPARNRTTAPRNRPHTASSAPSPPAGPATGATVARTPWPAVTIAMAGAFMAILDSFIVIVAGPAVQADLGASRGELQWILAGYQLTYAVFLVVGGRLGDMFGRKRMFVVGMTLFTLASVGCALAQAPGGLIVARLFQGLGAALMLPQVFALITVLVGEKDRHRAFGLLGVVLGLATIGGQLIGGLLIGADLFGSGWRPVFWINVPVGVVTVLLAARCLRESRVARARRLDLPGVAVLSAALFLLAFPLIQGREAGWPWWTWACFAASGLAFALFVRTEHRTAERGGDPLVRMSLFATRSFSVGIVLVLTLYAVITSYYLVLSIALQDGLGMSALEAGLVYTPAAVTFFVLGLVASRLVPKYGRRVLEAGAVALASGYASTALVLAGGLPFTPAVVIPTLMLQSIGGGLLITPSLNAVLTRIDPDDAGIASGVLSTAQQIGSALGVAGIGVVFFRSFHPSAHRVPADSVRMKDAAAHALAMSSLFTFALAVAATVLVHLLPRNRSTGGGTG
ncbi:MFS transporter [Streptomyces sp. NPDC048045]|uniref:MFS transporter n=1 Tax=Streptomyces sp. NPDC048045 TaxID=3154710 RepID=UPI00341B43FD